MGVMDKFLQYMRINDEEDEYIDEDYLDEDVDDYKEKYLDEDVDDYREKEK